MDLDEVERAMAPSFLRFRIRDLTIPAMPEGSPPPPDTVIGAFVRDVESRIAELEKAAEGSGSGQIAATPASTEPPAATAAAATSSGGSSVQDPAEQLADLREVLRLGRHLLEGRPVTL